MDQHAQMRLIHALERIAEAREAENSPRAAISWMLSDCDSVRAHRRAMNADGAYKALYEACQWLRDLVKYKDDPVVAASALREQLWTIMEDNGVDLNDWA